jgi:pilus assembly protein CpaB
MRMVFVLVLFVGIALAGAAVYMTQGYISQTQTALAKEREVRAKTGPLVEAFVVNKDKHYGQVLTKEDVQVVYIQESALPEGIFRDIAELFPEDKVGEKRYITRDLAKFELVLATKVTEPGEPAGLTGALDKGMRAFAIKVEAADFLQPGDRVDIYWTGSTENGSSEVTRLIGTAVEVVAVNRDEADGLSDGAIMKRTITVAADPQQIAILAQGNATGRLVMSLVGMGDETETGMVEVDANALLGVTEAAPAAVLAPDKVCTVRTRKGADVIEIPIPCTN